MSIITETASRPKRKGRSLAVKSAYNLTPNMRRVTLQGDALSDFPTEVEGGYVKLLFPIANSDETIVRTYTVAQQRSQLNEIDIDFMLHGKADQDHSGVAATWSISVEPGDSMTIMGPGSPSLINSEADTFLLAADMTGLPALSASLAHLPAEAQGHAFIEILSADDKQSLVAPKNITIHWIINDNPGADNTPLAHAIMQAERPQGQLAAWVACEFKSMKIIRQYLSKDLQIERSKLYISSYWKKGINEEEHKKVKQADLKTL